MTGGSIVVAVGVAGLELIARPGLRPTDLLATVEARTELGIHNQQMGAKPGELRLTEAQYQEAIAKAQREGQAAAELVFQQKLAVVQADVQRVVGAYQALYQRTNLIAQAGVQMEQQALQFRQRLIEQSNGGRVIVQNFADIGCKIGVEGACEAARRNRQEMIDESTELTEADVAVKVNRLMAGIPDPASLISERDQAEHGPPALPR